MKLKTGMKQTECKLLQYQKRDTIMMRIHILYKLNLIFTQGKESYICACTAAWAWRMRPRKKGEARAILRRLMRNVRLAQMLWWKFISNYIYRRWKIFRVKGKEITINTIRAWPTARAWRMRLRSFLQAQAAWAVARIVHHSLFTITLIFKFRLYIRQTNRKSYRAR